jgi:RNA recognition motif-containing protein
LDSSICIIYISGKIVPTKCLWIGNIPIDIKRRDFEYAFSRYGQIKTLDYSNGDPTATVTYIDIDDAIKARAKLIGTTQLTGGRIVRNESDASPSSRRGKEIRFPYR